MCVCVITDVETLYKCVWVALYVHCVCGSVQDLNEWLRSRSKYWPLLGNSEHITHCYQENVIFTVVLLCKISTYRWLHKCLATKESISIHNDLTWSNISLSFLDFISFTNVINIDAIIIINMSIVIILTLLIAK